MEDELKKKFSKIFKVSDVDFDAPSSSNEQDKLFLEVEKIVSSIKDKTEVGRVYGRGIMYSTNTKLPLNHFFRCVGLASKEDSKDLAFLRISENALVYKDVIERSFEFIYFFNRPFDPDKGSITTIEFTNTGGNE